MPIISTHIYIYVPFFLLLNASLRSGSWEIGEQERGLGKGGGGVGGKRGGKESLQATPRFFGSAYRTNMTNMTNMRMPGND